ncbi:metallophosphoesterase family protein [Methylocystis bryophila]|uniref:Metallophosphoesterase n=1 Tax=Methylocystis bryophila TaxID=655015 RepID=A0A1W6MY90_9HYPH|nr:DNA repair exonuclease [Methylocystis bryophila]ARN82557.1 metallophosphoesterase [Methylocystis bryophila]BDV38767.1 metallophosphoesterase [Methylocystis bryophila]
MGFTFIHAADLHIDSPLAGLGCKDALVRERFANAGRRAVQNLVTETIAAKAAFLLICGDIFDGEWRDVSTGHFFARELGRLERAGILTYIVKGNHDAESLISKDLPYPESVRIFPSRKADIFEIESLRVALHGRSFASRAVGGDFLASYRPRREGWLNIGLLHTALDGSRGHESYAPCTLDDLRRFGYDYWALGHVHAAEIVARDPFIVYPGNIQGRHARETGAKGAMQISVEEGRIVDVSPLTLDAARWAQALVDVGSCRDEADVVARIEAAMRAQYEGCDGRPVALRITLQGATRFSCRLVAERERLEEDMRAIGFRHAEDFWIESLKIETHAPPKKAPALAEADALDVEALISAAAADPQFSTILAELLATIEDKSPRELRGALESETSALRDEARDLLLGLLSEREGEA